MQLYLDSADVEEITEVMDWGIVDGLTTTPTFMHRSGVQDVDGLIVHLSDIVPQLQIEALGDTVEEICNEAHRQLELGLPKDRTVFKIPMSLKGVKACRLLTDDGIMVNMHLIYTLQQAYMAMQAGATYVCPLVGRLQDQGQDALGLVAAMIDMKNRYLYDSQIMFSSVRHVEHVRNALELGVDVCTIPYKVITKLTENHFTSLGTQQFEAHTRLMKSVEEVMRPADVLVHQDKKITEALPQMTAAGFGAVIIVDDAQNVQSIFTDGDLRRLLGHGEEALQQRFKDLGAKQPVSISSDQTLKEAQAILSEHKIDTLVVVQNEKALGLLDIQDIVS